MEGKQFKEIKEMYRFNMHPNTDLVISRAIRFDDEKVAYINHQSAPGSTEEYKGKGVRIPKIQIKNVIDALTKLFEQSKEGFENIEKTFSEEYRFDIGKNTDLVIIIKNDDLDRKSIFMQYQNQPGSSFEFKAKGTIIPFELVPNTTDALTKMIDIL